MTIHQRIIQLLSYDPVSGVFVWKVRRGGKAIAGSVAGRIANTGYIQIAVDGKRYSAHRLAWLYMTGEWPPTDLDHKDCDKLNNSWENLRLATQSQNMANRGRQGNNSSGFKGVSWSKKSAGWVAQISINSKVKYLGTFAAKELAFAAYCEASKIRGCFMNNGIGAKGI